MKKLTVIFSLIFLFFIPTDIHAQSDDFVVRQFNSDITINKDTSINITETIVVEFFIPRHGIYRDIPIVYPDGHRTIKANFKLKDIKNDHGERVRYEVNNNRQVKSIRIGDPDKLVNGKQTYIINYELDDIIQTYQNHIEFYWNVTGHEWNVDIESASATVNSPFADITNTDCYSGVYGEKEKLCRHSSNDQSAYFASTGIVYPGSDFTVVTAFTTENQLIFPGPIESAYDTIVDNSGYLFAIIPFLTIFVIWLKRGRDKRYISDNVYYKPDNRETKTVSVFGRKFLPMVYHPIDDLTPAEAGTIIDERVHISDVISEILELARLGYLQIQKIKKQGLIFSSDQYAFIKTEKTPHAKNDSRLADYQKYLLKEIFRKANVLRSVKEAEKLFKDDNELGEVRKKMAEYDYVLLSGLKNHFYEGLPVFKSKLYTSLDNEQIFHGNPEKVRQMWVGFYIFMQVISIFLLFSTAVITSNLMPLFIAVFFGIIGLILALSMPRRTAKGYSLKRQAEGLKWYLQKGKWRHEYAEKKLFIEEILPFAVALGVVDKLVDDMKELGIKPPSYFSGTTLSSFTQDINSFSSNTSSTLTSAPSSSGTSSWSGGSGFSGGGFSGGGFGGGGGGSW